jgi:uncharacterized protein (DUF2126 family)
MPEGEVDNLWLVDRLLRHLLVDLTGNTHRAEFCIDKLYSPDTASGRQGLVELRAFEMPPHSQMSLVQMLLLRSLIAWFWKTPYRHKLVRWGTELHDRFMLPHYVRADMAEVTENLQLAGYPFQMAWLDPFLEFRYPRLGTVHIGGIQLELRQAIEPWHVLGEEMSRAGTDRQPLRAGMLWVPNPYSSHRDPGRIRNRGTLPGLAAAFGPSSNHRRALTPGLRPGRYLEQALYRRMYLSCCSFRRPQL